MYADVVEARAKLKVQGKEPERLYLRPERVHELQEGVHTSKWTMITDSASLGMRSGMKVLYTTRRQERVVAEDGTIERLRNQMPSLIQ